MIDIKFPLWFIALILICTLIGLGIIIITSYFSFRGVYLLYTKQTTAALQHQAAITCIGVSAVLLLGIFAGGYLTSLEFIPHVLGFPFGFCAGQVVFLTILYVSGSASWMLKGSLPLLAVLNIFLNYTGYIAVIDKVKKRFGTKLS